MSSSDRSEPLYFCTRQPTEQLFADVSDIDCRIKQYVEVVSLIVIGGSHSIKMLGVRRT
jgi:hypothetical protein